MQKKTKRPTYKITQIKVATQVTRKSKPQLSFILSILPIIWQQVCLWNKFQIYGTVSEEINL